jgi:hypothetical protein
MFWIMRDALSAGGMHVVKMLRQDGRSESWATLDSIADTLVAIAIRDRDDDRRLGALNVLRVAGTLDPKAGGVPYPGAVERLILVHREAKDMATRRRALRGLLGGGNRQRALAYLGEAATARDETAWAAIQELTSDAANNGAVDSKALLRELYDKKRVRQFIAERNLWAYAAGQGWVPSPLGPVRPPPSE